MKRKIGILIVLAGIACFGIGGFMIVRNFIEENNANTTIAHIMEQMEIPEIGDSVEGEEEIIPDYILNPEMDMPMTKIDGKNYIGELSVPSLELDLPIMARWSYDNLKIAPNRYAGSAYLNNMILMAHNYDRHFGRFNTLQTGDEVIFTDVDGNEFRYQVQVVETIQPTAVEQMKTGDWDLTLFTCTRGGAARVTVRCTSVVDEGE